jgi:hypothetical protein
MRRKEAVKGRAPDLDAQAVRLQGHEIPHDARLETGGRDARNI